MVEFRQLAISFILIAIISSCLIMWVAKTQIDNSASVTIMDNPVINSTYSGLSNSLQTSSSDAQNQKTAQETEVPQITSGSLVFYTLPMTGKIISSSIIGIFNLLFGGISEILGVSPIIIAGLTGILIITIILTIWSLVRLGR